MKMNSILTKWIIILGLLIAVLIFFLGRCTAPKPVILSKSFKPDTVWSIKIVPGVKIDIDSLKATLITYRDKIVKVPWPVLIPGDTAHHDSLSVLPFEACLDTIINNDTLNIGFVYPLNIFMLHIKTHQDSIREKLIKVTETIMVEKQEVWWVKPCLFLAGSALGYLGGKVK